MLMSLRARISLWLLLLLLASSSLIPLHASSFQNSYAVVVGISNYSYGAAVEAPFLMRELTPKKWRDV
jgi:hypothetical protein